MKQKGGGGHETEGADEGDVDHLVETCTLDSWSAKTTLSILTVCTASVLLRVWLTRMMWTRQRSSPPRKIWRRLCFSPFYIFFCTFLRSSPPRRIFCSCLRAERGAAGDSRQLSADLLLTRTNVVRRISCPKDQQVFREGRSGKGALGAIFWEDFGQIGRPCLLRSD